MNNACVIGWGTVGKATAETFGITKYYSRSTSNITLKEAAKCDFIFICLPTPVNEQGEYYVKDIKSIVRELSKHEGFNEATVVIRSTVYPGFTKSLQHSLGIKNLVFNPEFLSEDTWKEDALKPQMVVIGAETPELREKLAGIYRGRFKYSEPIITDLTTAEMIKVTMNAWFVTKIVFANEIYDLCQTHKINYTTVHQVIQGHPWGAKNHFNIFHKGGRGASGKCLKKDISAFAHFAGHSAFLDIVQYRNQQLLDESGKI